MDYTPEQIAFQLNRGRTVCPPDFITAHHVEAVMTMRTPVYGSYHVCGWPTREEQSRIQDLAQADYYEAIAEADDVLLAAAIRSPRVVPCPEPSPVLTVAESMAADVTDDRTADHAWRRGLEAARRGESPYYGGTAWGRAHAAGIRYGRQFVL
jgi:hypothetical protein